jgi:sulfatase maturation enzyme AslB (radical SAM superfamily)
LTGTVTFFDIMDRYVDRSGKKLEYSVQTNISILRPEIIDLFKAHGVHFSVHYDGELDNPELLSKRRRDNIVTLSEEGFPVTVLVVGTAESLKVLPSSIQFFNGAVSAFIASIMFPAREEDTRSPGYRRRSGPRPIPGRLSGLPARFRYAGQRCP